MKKHLPKSTIIFIDHHSAEAVKPHFDHKIILNDKKLARR